MEFLSFCQRISESPFCLPLIAVLAYLLGSFNTAVFVSKMFYKKDIRDFGSGNAGFTNAVRCFGAKMAMWVMVGDVTKCALACLIGQLLYAGSFSFALGAPGRLLAGAFAFLGHLYPLYFGFRGGKGVVTMAITVAFFDWRIFLIGFVLFFVIVLTTRYISLGSIAISVLFPVAVFLFYCTGLGGVSMSYGYLAVAAMISLIIILKHRTNIVRLIHGQESRFSFRTKPILDRPENNRKEKDS